MADYEKLFALINDDNESLDTEKSKRLEDLFLLNEIEKEENNIIPQEEVDDRSLLGKYVDNSLRSTSDFLKGMEATLADSLLGKSAKAIERGIFDNVFFLPENLREKKYNLINKVRMDALEAKAKNDYQNPLAESLGRRIGDELGNPLNIFPAIRAYTMASTPLAALEESALESMGVNPDTAKSTADWLQLLSPTAQGKIVKGALNVVPKVYEGYKTGKGLVNSLASVGGGVKEYATDLLDKGKDWWQYAKTSIPDTYTAIKGGLETALRQSGARMGAKDLVDFVNRTGFDDVLNKGLGFTRYDTDPRLWTLIESGYNKGDETATKMYNFLIENENNPLMKQLQEKGLDYAYNPQVSPSDLRKALGNALGFDVETTTPLSVLEDKLGGAFNIKSLPSQPAQVAEFSETSGNQLLKSLNKSEAEAFNKYVTTPYSQFTEKYGDRIVELDPTDIETLVNDVNDGRALLQKTLGQQMATKLINAVETGSNEVAEIAASAPEIKVKDFIEGMRKLSHDSWKYNKSGEGALAKQAGKEARLLEGIISTQYPEMMKEYNAIKNSAKNNYYRIYNQNTTRAAGKLLTNPATNEAIDMSKAIDTIQTSEDFRSVMKMFPKELRPQVQQAIVDRKLSQWKELASKDNANYSELANTIDKDLTNMAFYKSLTNPQKEAISEARRQLAVNNRWGYNHGINLSDVPKEVINNRELAQKFLSDVAGKANKAEAREYFVGNSLYDLVKGLETSMKSGGNKLQAFEEAFNKNSEHYKIIKSFAQPDTIRLLDEVIDKEKALLKNIPNNASPEDIMRTIQNFYKGNNTRTDSAKFVHGIINILGHNYWVRKRQEGLQELAGGIINNRADALEALFIKLIQNPDQLNDYAKMYKEGGVIKFLKDMKETGWKMFNEKRDKLFDKQIIDNMNDKLQGVGNYGKERLQGIRNYTANVANRGITALTNDDEGNEMIFGEPIDLLY